MSMLRRLGEQVVERMMGTARSSAHALVGQIVMAVAGLMNFLILARLLGPSTYGLVAGALALVLTVGPIAALGADKIATRDIARDSSTAARTLTHALLTVIVGSSVSGVAIWVLQPLILPQVPRSLLLALVVAEALGNGVMICSVGTRFALGHGRAGGNIMVANGAAKIVAVVAFALAGSGDPIWWASVYAALVLSTAVGATVLTFRQLGRPRFAGYRLGRQVREGLPYSLNVTATVAQNDIDKTLLVRFGYSSDAGLYSVAYRLATMAWLPVLAVLQASLPRFFAVGATEGLSATVVLARKLLRPLLAYGVFAAIVLVAIAPLIPIVVGEEYRGSVTLLMLLAPLAMLKAAQYLPSDALTGAGYQPTRTLCIVASMGLNLALGLLFIPTYGVVAALVATVIAELVYIALIQLAIRWHGARERRAASVPVEEST